MGRIQAKKKQNFTLWSRCLTYTLNVASQWLMIEYVLQGCDRDLRTAANPVWMLFRRAHFLDGQGESCK